MLKKYSFSMPKLGYFCQVKSILVLLCLFCCVKLSCIAQPASFNVQNSTTHNIVDSIFEQKSYLTDLNHHRLLSEHKTYINTVRSIPRNSTNKTGPFLIAICLLFVISFLIRIFPKYISNLFSIFSFNSSKKQHKEQLENDGRASLGFYILYVFSLSFILFNVILHFGKISSQYAGFSTFLVSFLLIAGALLLKNGMVWFFAWVFQRQTDAKNYSFNNAIINEFGGMILFPLSILVLLTNGQFRTVLLIIAIVVMLVLWLYKYVRNLKNMINLFRIDFVHFLLYLCAFELVPLAVLYKVVNAI
jgi:hypothetical protein